MRRNVLATAAGQPPFRYDNTNPDDIRRRGNQTVVAGDPALLAAVARIRQRAGAGVRR